VSIKKELSQQLEGLPLGDVVVRVEQFLILDEDLVEVRLQEVSRDHLVSGQQVLKGSANYKSKSPFGRD